MRAKVLAVTLAAAFALTACGSDQDALVGTWQPVDEEGHAVIAEDAGALHIEITSGNCEGIVTGEDPSFELALECIPEGDISSHEETATLKIVDDDTIIVNARDRVFGGNIPINEDFELQRIESG